eukprot:9423864-Heterocapsa_arctica.AAC.1
MTCQNSNPRSGVSPGSAISPIIFHSFLRRRELNILTERERGFQKIIIELYNQEAWIRETFLRDIEAQTLDHTIIISFITTEAAQVQESSGYR